MKIADQIKMKCPCCLKEHVVEIVLLPEKTIFKDVSVDYEGAYLYCDVVNEFVANEKQVQENDTRMKDAYRKAVGLLTSQDIAALRTKYQISQNDLCLLLGWGLKTITRYEAHQIQDRAHDSILKKLSEDPGWFLELLQQNADRFAANSYKKYFEVATQLYREKQNNYLHNSLCDVVEKIKEESAKQVLTEVAKSLYADGMNVELIAKYVGYSVDAVKQWLGIAA
ncbi:MAG: hypothetical protein Q4D21_04385 [Phascolarctobacterium sp.]|nr:hypothetical protein [Phascolarctobacterium sp.]